LRREDVETHDLALAGAPPRRWHERAEVRQDPPSRVPLPGDADEGDREDRAGILSERRALELDRDDFDFLDQP